MNEILNKYMSLYVCDRTMPLCEAMQQATHLHYQPQHGWSYYNNGTSLAATR